MLNKLVSINKKSFSRGKVMFFLACLFEIKQVFYVFSHQNFDHCILSFVNVFHLSWALRDGHLFLRLPASIP
ncbi:hypothetical protein HCUR_00249 [Holospora curviuscula]|uniref:Uncharacterized protein n=1 Tax=Holospora curviuscula TaxID=1082868 RepID=A0A2S5RE62_9PROT|nr:hypothetical protein HCUR_00249 [Holospora curviuscula]